MPNADFVRVRGGIPLAGEVIVRGAKNTLPKHLVASLLTDNKCVLNNVADVRDVRTTSEIIAALGGEVQTLKHSILSVSTACISEKNLLRLHRFHDLTRISILLAAPLLHRFGRTMLVRPGGCYIGPRPTNFHEDVLERFGAKRYSRNGVSYMKADRLIGTEVTIPRKSVGATEQALFASVLAEGRSILRNAATEPEVADLIDCLTDMGAHILSPENGVYEVDGVPFGSLTGFNHIAMTDRSEVASWACAALATGGRIRVINASANDLEFFLEAFDKAGGQSWVEEDAITFSSRQRVAMPEAHPLTIETRPHPGFRTDWQPPLVAALCAVRRQAVIHETIFENRFGFLNTLDEMGAGIDLVSTSDQFTRCSFCTDGRKHIAVLQGRAMRPMQNAIRIADLRGGFAQLIAALSVAGESLVANVSHLDKGYERLVEKVQLLGGSIEPAGGSAWQAKPMKDTVATAGPGAISLVGFDLREFNRLYKEVKCSSDNDSRGKTLEGLAKYIFRCIPELSLVSERCRGQTDELDIVFAVHSPRSAQLQLLGQIFPVECRNVSSPVPAKAVRDLCGKIRHRSIRSAFIITTNRLTRDAHEACQIERQSSGILVVGIEGAHLEKIRNGDLPGEIISGCIFDTFLGKRRGRSR